ncbi:hypothetical protein GLOIN_2v1512850 [Rhizophagus clarus]|uniref:Uncharacterized protein n=1 Tax=Rhizophagus clarus TaxID=94130 RepID=A0A8H3LV84_9GLOM|nr:hypothetical protein GLOIN_2v1512850 [Rhizophagus clarus]
MRKLFFLSFNKFRVLNGSGQFGLPCQPKLKKFSVGDEKSINGKIGISKTPGFEITGRYKKNNSTKYSSQKWEFKYKGPYNRGEYWSYERNNKLGVDEETYAPRVHVGEWFVYEFCIIYSNITL